MKWFWLGFWVFLTALVVSAAIMRPDTVDATLAFTGRFVTVAAWTLFGAGGGGAGHRRRHRGVVGSAAQPGGEPAPEGWALPAAAREGGRRARGHRRPQRAGRDLC
jgi:hypothetical protein